MSGNTEMEESGLFQITAKSTESNTKNLYIIENVLNTSFLEDVKKEVAKIPLEKALNDLNAFEQSEKLDSSNVNPNSAIRRLLDFLKSKVHKTVEQCFGIKTSNDITATVSKYSRGNYLLCHDDLHGPRAIAFVLYLTTLTESDGGSLQFLRHDNEDQPIPGSCCHKESPKENTLVLFKVNKTSHHEVEQVFSDKNRVSVNGWFHHVGRNPEFDSVQLDDWYRSEILTTETPIRLVGGKHFSREFLSREVIKVLNKKFDAEKATAIAINNFLDENFYKSCVTELESSSNEWVTKGPANYRFYEVMPYKFENAHVSFGEGKPHLDQLVNILLSHQFLQSISAITDIEYAVFNEHHIPPTCMIELQRWKEGHYFLLNDNSVEKTLPTVDVTIFFKVNREVVGEANSETDLSGVVVQTIRPRGLKRAIKARLYQFKLERMHRMYYEFIQKNKIISRRVNRSVTRTRWMNAMSEIVQVKINKMHLYRKNQFAKNNHTVPVDNLMAVSLASSKVVKYTSYLKKRETFLEPRIGYYALSVTIFTSPE